MCKGESMKRFLIILSVFVLWFSVAKGQIVQADSGFAGGSGTTANPWQISTPEQLNKLREKDGESGFRYILINDIDLTFDTQDPDGLYYNDGKGWEPIADFRGRLNGNGYTISGLYIDRPDEDNVGLFGVKEGGHIRNLRLSNAYIAGFFRVGGLIGEAVDTDLWAVETVDVVVEADTQVGGLIGAATDVSIFGAHVFKGDYGMIIGNLDVGGLVGSATGEFDVLHAINESTIQGQATSENVGGLLGHFIDLEDDEDLLSISFSENLGIVVGLNNVGGIIGRTTYDDWSSYSLHYVLNHGTVMGSGNVGGIIGSSNMVSLSEGWINTGMIMGTFNVGGLIGYHDLSTYSMTFSAGTNTGTVTGNDNTGALFGNMVDDSGKNGFNIWNMQALDSELEVVGLYLGEPLVSDYTTYDSVEDLFESSAFAYVRDGTNNFFGYELVDDRIQAKSYNMVDILGDGTVTGQSGLNWIQYFVVSELIGFMSVSEVYYDYNLGVDQPTFGYSYEDGTEFVFNFSRDREDDDIGMEELLPVTSGRKFVFLYAFDANEIEDEDEELPQTSDRSLMGSFLLLLLGLVLVSKSKLKKV
jgi:hypothetical protein